MIGQLYFYTARRSDGAFVSGSLQAESHEKALANLRLRALFVTSLERSGSARAAGLSMFGFLPLDEGARVGFFRAFATLIASGVPMQRALDVALAQCKDRRLAEALRAVASDLEQGSSLSSAMSRRPREFSELFVAMVRAGELAGALDEILERLATLLERDRALRKRVAAALAYPAVVAASALGLMAFLIANTVPAFAAMFSGLHVELPLSTRILIAMASALHGAGIWSAFAASAILICGATYVLRAVPRCKSWWHGIRIHVPLFGPLVRKTTVARIARTLGTLLRAGVPVLAALDATRDVVENVHYASCIAAVAASLRAGDSLIEPIEQSGLFDPLVVQLLRAGDETGTLDAMLLRLADYYELDVETAIAALSSLVEPCLVIVLGAIVGVIVGSILVPLYSLIGSIH